MIAGPNGVTLFESYSGDPRSWPADPEEYERILADRGLTKLPLKTKHDTPPVPKRGKNSKPGKPWRARLLPLIH